MKLMKLVTNRPRTKDANGIPIKGTGTYDVLVAILYQHPQHSKAEFQRKVHAISKSMAQQENEPYFRFTDGDYKWLMDAINTADLRGVRAGQLLEDFDLPITTEEYPYLP